MCSAPRCYPVPLDPAVDRCVALRVSDRVRLPAAEPTVLDENQATRGKVERLKLVLEERRQRRRQRRSQRSAPYTTSWSATSSRPEAAAGAPHSSADAADAEMPEVAAAPALVACGGQSGL